MGTKIERRILWRECLEFRALALSPWNITGGDFNVTGFLGIPHEGDFSAMEEFDKFITSGNLTELPLSNKDSPSRTPERSPPWRFLIVS